jgi:hypothetical protein
VTKAIMLKDGGRTEVRLPELLAVDKVSGNWTTLKPSAYASLIGNRIHVLTEGWYTRKGGRPKFYDVGDNFKSDRPDTLLGPWN